jgi:ABC-2 type transport system permease protein
MKVGLMQAGTLPWLLRHHLLLVWRETQINRSIWAVLIVGALVFMAIPFFLWNTIAQAQARTPELGATLEILLFWIAAAILGFVAIFSLGGGLMGSLKSLLERSDLDLLISSPVDSQIVFASRLLGIAAQLFLGYCWITVPLIPFLSFTGQLGMVLGIHIALLCIAVSCASIAMLLTVWCVGQFGIKATRTLFQVGSVGFSLLFLAIVHLDFIPIRPNPDFFLSPQGLLASDSLIWFPVRTLFFHGPSVVLNLALTTGLAWGTVRTMHQFYLQSSQQETTTVAPPTKGSGLERRFGANLSQLLLMKEWRLMLRNPMLLSQIGLQILYIMFMFFVLFREGFGGMDANTLVAIVSVYAGGNLATILTRICVAGEEIPNLLRTSPIPDFHWQGFKILAALIPTWLLLSPIFLLTVLQGSPWLKILLLILGATGTTALVSLWNSRSATKADLFQFNKENQADVILAFLQFALIILWAIVAFVGLKSGLLATISTGIHLTLIGVVLVFAYWRYWEISQGNLEKKG